jgi:hypothetical protein
MIRVDEDEEENLFRKSGNVTTANKKPFTQILSHTHKHTRKHYDQPN